MNDVLPKPFTKEGLMAMLDKHLAHLKKGYVESASHHTTRHALKEEDSSSKGSPAGMSASWNSPAQMTAMSPAGGNIPDEYMSAMRNNPAYVDPQHRAMHYESTPITPTGQRIPSSTHRRHISDISGGEEHAVEAKRQHMYAPQMPMHGHVPR